MRILQVVLYVLLTICATQLLVATQRKFTAKQLKSCCRLPVQNSEDQDWITNTMAFVPSPGTFKKDEGVCMMRCATDTLVCYPDDPYYHILLANPDPAWCICSPSRGTLTSNWTAEHLVADKCYKWMEEQQKKQQDSLSSFL